jgi:hypothetical protein
MHGGCSCKAAVSGSAETATEELTVMMTEVKRSYDASGQRQQARARRLAVVLAAAHDMCS